MLQETVMKDRLYITGKMKDVLAYLKKYQKQFSTVQELIESKFQ